MFNLTTNFQNVAIYAEEELADSKNLFQNIVDKIREINEAIRGVTGGVAFSASRDDGFGPLIIERNRGGGGSIPLLQVYALSGKEPDFKDFFLMGGRHDAPPPAPFKMREAVNAEDVMYCVYKTLKSAMTVQELTALKEYSAKLVNTQPDPVA